MMLDGNATRIFNGMLIEDSHPEATQKNSRAILLVFDRGSLRFKRLARRRELWRCRG
ncbi:conserved hypothetical protein [Ricinus communis]|uniref:Uncharacterized protein n=1 Tax=Ricinus communis TaxID=3988 RepID=B9SWQ6_RICCO|nr:conserved hypothetical protein [Ricinus communis]